MTTHWPSMPEGWLIGCESMALTVPEVGACTQPLPSCSKQPITSPFRTRCPATTVGLASCPECCSRGTLKALCQSDLLDRQFAGDFLVVPQPQTAVKMVQLGAGQPCLLHGVAVASSASRVRDAAGRLAWRADLMAGPGPGPGTCCGLGANHRDAVDGAGRQAQIAAGALGFDDRVHPFRGAEDRVHRAGLDAQRAADTGGFVDDGHPAGLFFPVFRIQRQRLDAQQVGQRPDAGLAAGRALVDRRFAGRRSASA